MASLIWTDRFGRSYPYEPYVAIPIAQADLRLSSDATMAIVEASRMLGSLPVIPLAGVVAVLCRSESSASSNIAGITAGPRRVLEAEFAGSDEINDKAGTRIVRNLYGLQDATKTTWPARSVDFLRWHRLLTAEQTTTPPHQMGAYRDQQNWIGGGASGPRRATFIPPAPEDIETLITDLEVFCARADVTPLVQAFVAHSRFEVIHPFVHGNGRVGRMLLQHLLVRRLELPTPIPISVLWSRNPGRYIVGLRAYQEGDLDTWIEIASISLLEAIERVKTANSEISHLLEQMRSRAGTRGTSVAWSIIRDLPTYPLLDSMTVAERYGITTQAAHSALARLEERGILARRAFTRRRKIEGRPRQVFTTPELINLLGRLSSA
jgi:Fic family protein